MVFKVYFKVCFVNFVYIVKLYMKKTLPLLPILFLIYWGCDKTPPTVSISSHNSGQFVNQTVTIIVTTQDNKGISRVEFFIDDSHISTDSKSPYEYDWNTTQYDDGSEHIVKVISYDNFDNSTESQPILLIIDNRVYLWGEYYSIENTETLSLSNNRLTGEIPPEIGNLINLKSLKLENNQLTGSIPPEIGNLTNLETLSLSNNQLTGSIPPEIGNLNNLTRLGLNKNQLIGNIPESICDLKINWNNSDDFLISNNQLCPPYPSCIEDYVGYQDTSGCD